MKRIINGLRYDTERADLLAEYGNGLDRRNFRWCWERLYRTKNENFFLFGKGGPLSSYASGGRGIGWTDGQAIVPLSDEEVMEWLELREMPDLCEELFPNSIEDA